MLAGIGGSHRQGKRKKGKEEKIAAIHQGWEVSGKRVRLKNKRHFIHRGDPAILGRRLSPFSLITLNMILPSIKS
ncbi:UPF0236 family protein [Aeribacillus composti]|uniref:UPF0236 family transposase-like protein n=1 Tax=Aeribacillus composti TaxID=1868734 RepID=UPI002E1CD14D|nr:UPF0236 family protein [Aeribacillus composti]